MGDSTSSKTRVPLLALSLMAMACQARAGELFNGDAAAVRWDNTLKYSTAQRTGTRTGDMQTVQARQGGNNDDGDASFSRGGLVLNRVDLLSEFDLQLKDRASSGLSVSAAGWYDAVYRRGHAPLSDAARNTWSVPANQFSATTRRVNGTDIELLNLFAHSGVDLGGHELSFRLGRHTLLWGESLLLASNGIAAGMGAVDAVKALSLPGATTKEIFLPTNQLSASLAVNDRWDLQGYYQFEHRRTRVTPPGSYFSTADMVFDGGERIIAAQLGGPGNEYFTKTEDPHVPKTGQWGMAAKYRNNEAGLDVGLYYLRYSAKIGQVYTQLTNDPTFGQIPVLPLPTPLDGGFSIGRYFFVYPEQIELFGASTAFAVGDASVGTELSIRRNMPLASAPTVLNVAPGPITVNGRDNFLHPVGDTLHGQVSWIMALGPGGFWDAMDVAGDIGGHVLLQATRNAQNQDRSKSPGALGLGLNVEPKWYQALPDVDLSMPINLSHSFTGPSRIDPEFVMGIAHGGSATVGLKAVYRTLWRGALSYTRFYGDVQSNPYRDRSYLSASLSYSF